MYRSVVRVRRYTSADSGAFDSGAARIRVNVVTGGLLRSALAQASYCSCGRMAILRLGYFVLDRVHRWRLGQRPRSDEVKRI